MDNEVIEFDIGLGGGGGRDGDDDFVDIEHPVDDEEMVDSPLMSSATGSASGIVVFGGGGSGEIYLPEGDLLDLEPYDGMEFESEEAAKAFYNSYARRVGFSTRVSSSRRSRRDGAIIQRQFVCAKEGFRNLNEKRTKDREIKRPRTITRVGCKASLSVKMQDSGKWVVSGFVKEHNHELVPPDQVHCLRSHRQISDGAKSSETYDIALDALKEATKKVAHATKNDGKTMVNGHVRGNLAGGAGRIHYASGDHEGSSGQHLSEDDMDKKIRELTNELQCANRKCEVYRANLLSVLKDIEDHKLQLSIKVQNIKIGMKDGL
ncbi:protein FAR1-RELATED SEQUENCE 5 [Prunus yedoensis var. nudiflora]|uniref:Protein FAR1-RELATED SEQUENCE 5 n=1 Tax=Prunus yedoensis var. nudiflora TaxID=2094558 RepID=A0A314YYQ3_PRUYE|nr:protein FAR1-RELATED SEQUENCE 5 [Prunus yedoensis var. nudiflora]